MHEQVEPKIVDASVLDGLRVYAKSGAFLQQIVEIYEQHGRVSMEELTAAMGSEDGEAVRRIAHRLKGSCLNVGASLMAQKLKELEQLVVKNPPFNDVQAAVENIGETFVDTCKALKSMV